MIRYGACVGSWDRIARYVEPRIEGREFIGLSGQPSLAVAYNRILDMYARSHDGPVVLLHDDLEITDPAFEAKVEQAIADHPGAALIGVCGGTDESSLAWWNGPTVGHQATDAMILDFGVRTGEVAVLEGSVLVFTPWAVQYLRYDTSFPGFHSADEVCLNARAAGRTLVVADIDTHHHTPMGFRTAAGEAAWAAGDAIYRRKLARWRSEAAEPPSPRPHHLETPA